MNVLDIDIDFFLNPLPLPPPNRIERGSRLSSDEYSPWSPLEVQRYLIDHCGLSKDHRLPGCVVTHHDELFDRWNALVASGELRVPFHLAHVDSHADMGMGGGIGDASWLYIMSELLHRDPSDRTNPDRGGLYGLKECNFVLFAVACRWISSMDYVHHPDMQNRNCGLHDIPNCLFVKDDPDSGVIRLKKLPRKCYKELRSPIESTPLGFEPEVAINLVDAFSFFSKRSYSFIFAAHSPEYTPPTSDPILDTIRQFIDEEN